MKPFSHTSTVWLIALLLLSCEKKPSTPSESSQENPEGSRLNFIGIYALDSRTEVVGNTTQRFDFSTYWQGELILTEDRLQRTLTPFFPDMGPPLGWSGRYQITGNRLIEMRDGGPVVTWRLSVTTTDGRVVKIVLTDNGIDETGTSWSITEVWVKTPDQPRRGY